MTAVATRAVACAPLLHYGVQVPARARSRALDGLDVVLQPYHPLVAGGGFADWFPGCRRFVYWNPSCVPTDSAAAGALPVVEVDAAWGVSRVDLSSAGALDHVVGEAVTALSADGGRVDGLFVDDLDRVLASLGPARTLALLERVADARPVSWFLNRGFGLWGSLPGLSAVLLEGLGAADLAQLRPEDLAWVRAVVRPALLQARAAGARTYALTYDTSRTAAGPLDDLLVATAVADRLLEHLPGELL